MAEHDTYTSAQLEKIRGTLSDSLGNSSNDAIDRLDERFVAKEDSPLSDATTTRTTQPTEESRKKLAEKRKFDLDLLINKGNLQSMLAGVEYLKDDYGALLKLVRAILDHQQTKAFHLLEVLKILNKNPEILEMLVSGMIARKGINHLIDAMHIVKSNPESMKKLASSIADQGTVNHIIRTIATAPKEQPEAETILTMEVIARGTVKQILEVFKLIEPGSPGGVVLATGLVNRKEVTIESLVVAIKASKDDILATTILTVALANLADVPTLVNLLEKYISDTTYAGEILTSKLVHQSLNERGRIKLMAKAAQYMHSGSIAGQILAMGIVEQGDVVQMERAYNRMRTHPIGQKIVAVGIIEKLGTLKAMRILGSQYFNIAKFQTQVSSATKEARELYKHILKENLAIVETRQAPSKKGSK